MSMRLNLFVFAFFGICIGYSMSTVCYVCQNCANPADVNTYTNNSCPGPCMKIQTFIPTMGVYIYKACTTQCTEQKRYFGFSTFEVKCCTSDRCNTATRNSAAYTWLTVVFVLVSYLSYKLC